MHVTAVRIATAFFQNTQLFTQCISMLYTEKSALRLQTNFPHLYLLQTTRTYYNILININTLGS